MSTNEDYWKSMVARLLETRCNQSQADHLRADLQGGRTAHQLAIALETSTATILSMVQSLAQRRQVSMATIAADPLTRQQNLSAALPQRRRQPSRKQQQLDWPWTFSFRSISLAIKNNNNNNNNNCYEYIFNALY